MNESLLAVIVVFLAGFTWGMLTYAWFGGRIFYVQRDSRAQDNLEKLQELKGWLDAIDEALDEGILPDGHQYKR